MAPEPLWLVVWGAALIAFSSTVRARTRARHEAPDPEPGRLAVIAASLARSA